MDLDSIIKAGGRVVLEITAEDLLKFAEKLIEKTKEMEASRQSQTRTKEKGLSSEDKWFTLEEAANYLFIKKTSLYNLTCQHKIGYYKSNRRCYFKKKDLDAWLSRCHMKSQDEINSEAAAYIVKKRW